MCVILPKKVFKATLFIQLPIAHRLFTYLFQSDSIDRKKIITLGDHLLNKFYVKELRKCKYSMGRKKKKYFIGNRGLNSRIYSKAISVTNSLANVEIENYDLIYSDCSLMIIMMKFYLHVISNFR